MVEVWETVDTCTLLRDKKTHLTKFSELEQHIERDWQRLPKVALRL